MLARSIRNLARALAGATLLLALSAHAAADVSAKRFGMTGAGLAKNGSGPGPGSGGNGPGNGPGSGSGGGSGSGIGLIMISRSRSMIDFGSFGRMIQIGSTS